ncbi:hypothetical protein HRG34_11210 [Enterococcus faecalis]|nr:hypothetical protein [Enterococcus faecalis]
MEKHRESKGEKGQKIEVYTAPGELGKSSEGKQLVESMILTKDADGIAGELQSAKKSIEVKKNY